MTGLRTASPSWPAAVIFDLDGTLVDSAPDICTAVNVAFAPLGVPTITRDEAVRLIGGGAAKALLRATKKFGLDEAVVDQAELLARFMPAYLEESKKGRGLYPGAHELLSELKERGVRLAICTNKAQPVTDVVVNTLDLARYCDIIIGARDGVAKKPDPHILNAALDAMNATASTAAMVGDSSADVKAAKAAGLPVIVMSYGYTPAPHDLGGDVVIEQLSQVPDALKNIAALNNRV